MFPWLWVWSPQNHLPFSGAVKQDISPVTSWFSDYISEEAGNAVIEEEVSKFASYGTQISLLTKVLVAIADERDDLSSTAQQALTDLHKIQDKVAELKQQERTRMSKEVLDHLRALKREGGDDYKNLVVQLNQILTE